MLSETLFNFELYTKIHFGSGALANLGAELDDRRWHSPLILTDAGVGDAGLLSQLEQELSGLGCSWAVYDGVVPDADVNSIEQSLPLVEGHDVLVALGGGSSIDTAKALNVLRTHGRRVLDWQGNDAVPGPCGPLIAIPTTAGTGSEVTFIAQVADPERKRKCPIVSRHLAPDVAIVDPELTMSMPPSLTAATGMDALTHAIEAATTLAEQPLADILGFHAVSLIHENLSCAVHDGRVRRARTSMAFASLLAGIAFNNAWVALAHAISHALGGLYEVPHGIGCAIALPAAMEFNLQAKPDKFDEIAKRLGQPDGQAGIDRVRRLNQEVGLPSQLSELGISQSDAEKVAELALADGSVLFNPRPVSPEEMLDVVRSLY